MDSRSWSKQDLLQIAKWQKNIIWMLLLFFFVHIGLPLVALIALSPDSAAVLVALAYFVHIAIQASFALELAIAIRSEFAGMYLVSVLIPYVCVIALLRLNANATAALRSCRIHVGLMGAKMADFE